MEKNSFIIYKDWYYLISALSNEDAGILFKAIFEYYTNGKAPKITKKAVLPVFSFMLSRFSSDDAKWENKCKKNSENVSKRYGRIQSNTNSTDNDNDSDNVSDNVSESDNGNEQTRAHYGKFNNVTLSQEEYKKLKAEYTDADAKIEYLSSYIKSTGKTYSDHYATIVKWAQEDKQKTESIKPKPKPSYDIDLFEKMLNEDSL